MESSSPSFVHSSLVDLETIFKTKASTILVSKSVFNFKLKSIVLFD